MKFGHINELLIN